VNEESYAFAATGKAEYPLISVEGGKEPLRAEYSSNTMGSDHDVYQDSSFGIPAIYMNDWPDRYIHTNFDTAANVDTTKLKRAAFIGAASGYYLAMSHTREDLVGLAIFETPGRSRRTELEVVKRLNFPTEEHDDVIWNWSLYERAVANSTQSWFGEKLDLDIGNHAAVKPTGEGMLKFKRKSEPKGPLAVFGYDYFADHAKAAGVATPKLFGYEGLWGGGEEYAYEVLNFADGKRNAQEIRDAVSAEYGPVPLEMVVEYLRALEKIGLVAEVK